MKIFLFLASIGLVLAGPKEDGAAFLAANAKKEDVISLPSGLQYKVLNSGDGDSHPTVSTKCKCHYHGTLIDGSVFDSSVQRNSPIDFAPNQVIKGWTEAMQLMVEGDKFELYIPSDLAYGDRGSPPKIPGGSTLIFTIEMLEIKGKKVPAKRCDVVTKEKCSEKETEYIDQKGSLSVEELLKEKDRLKGMASGSMKPELMGWLTKRITLLEKMANSKSPKAEL